MNSQTPGLQTVADWSREDLARFRSLGYEWIQYQTQNGDSTKLFALAPAKDVGLNAGVWGVTYDADEFERDGKLLGETAVATRADHVVMNCEMAAKDTRATRGLRPIVAGIRKGGWTGPVSFSTLGAPVNPTVNDFEMDVESFLETGGSVLCQAYVNAHAEYHPRLCIPYWTRVGVPRDRLNVTIGLYDAESEGGRRWTGAEYRDVLVNAGSGRGISIFRPETAVLWSDLEELASITTAPPPPSTVDPASNRLVALSRFEQSIGEWRRTGLVEEKVQLQRQTLAHRVLMVAQTGENLRAIRDLLDRLGAPKP